VLNESAVAIRTKAMKSLSAVISADPSILSRVSAPLIGLQVYRSSAGHLVLSCCSPSLWATCTTSLGWGRGGVLLRSERDGEV